MANTGKEQLFSFLFEGGQRKLLNIKFLRGDSSSLTEEQLCAAAHSALSAAISDGSHFEDKPPVSARVQVEASELIFGR